MRFLIITLLVALLASPAYAFFLAGGSTSGATRYILNEDGSRTLNEDGGLAILE